MKKSNIPNIQTNVALAPYTTYKIGGPADFFVEVNSKDELIKAVKTAREQQIPYFVLGTGANILVTDKGFRGLVIHNKSAAYQFFPDNKLTAESGVVIAELIDACHKRGLSGLEHFVGIPSSVGGAIWQNLHFLSPDRTRTVFIEEIVESGQILDEQGEIKNVDKEFFQFGYDYSILHQRPIIVLEITFKLSAKPQRQILKVMLDNIAWRTQKQPQLWEYPSCGSVFKKIEGVGAGRLIEQAGLKGRQIGGAKISEKHANYIVNLGAASAADVLALIELTQKEVKQKTGHFLEPEITIVGEL